MLTSMMCVQKQGGVGEIHFEFKITVGKDGWAYGYWDNKPSKIEPDYLHQLFKELYVMAGGGGVLYVSNCWIFRSFRIRLILS